MTYQIRPAPHVRHSDNIKISMADVLAALLPCAVMATVYNGMRFLVILSISVLTALICELVISLVFSKKQTVGDLSAVVTGAICAMLMPASVPYIYAVIAPLIGITVAKWLFGGVGKNVFNPALIGIATLMLTNSAKMSDYASPMHNLSLDSSLTRDDYVLGTSVLTALKDSTPITEDKMLMLIGYTAGAAGATCILVILAAAAYLMYRRIISSHITFSVLATVAIISILFPRADGVINSLCYELMGGSLAFCSVFCATDPVTTPNTVSGKIFFGIGIGAITMLVRYFGDFNDGIVFAILIMNALSFAMDKLVWNVRPKGVDK